MIKMGEIKQFKELVAIKLKDGRVITTEMPIATVAEMLNTKDFILVGDIGIGKYEVRSFEKFKPDELECFIYSQPKDISEKLQAILEERKSKNLNTNGTKHLWDIYLSRIGENANTRE